MTTVSNGHEKATAKVSGKAADKASTSRRGEKDGEGELLRVPLSTLRAEPEINARQEVRDVAELAESIREHGQISPLTVRRGAGGIFIIGTGNRRYAAFKMLRWSGDRLVDVKIVDPKTDEELHRINLVENVNREDLHPADLAQRLWELTTGNYARVIQPDVEAKPVEKKALASSLGISVAYLNNLVRVQEKLDPGLKKLWRRHDVPLRRIFDWAALSAEEQLVAYQEWHEDQEQQRGKTKKPKSGGGRGGVGAEADEDEEDAEADGVGGPSKKAIRLKMENLHVRLEQAQGKVKVAVLRAKIESLRWVLGEITKF